MPEPGGGMTFTVHIPNTTAETVATTTDESNHGNLALYDISAKTDIQYLGEYASNFDGIVHNTFIVGDTAHCSYYEEGYIAVDISDPKLEVARQIQMAEPRYGVDIILFDGEDCGQTGETEFALGARYFAANKDKNYRPAFGILLDMVGDSDLQIYQEHNSLQYAPQVVNRVWDKAAELGLPSFHAEPRYQVTDDHLPLLEAGIPCIDLIDFDYPYWHTSEDTPEKCSAESLAEVGRLLLALIY